MRKLWLTIWYAFEDFLGSGWWLAALLALTALVPIALHQAGFRAPSSSKCIQYSSYAESC